MVMNLYVCALCILAHGICKPRDEMGIRVSGAVAKPVYVPKDLAKYRNLF